MDAERVSQGRCLCSAVRYQYTGAENWRCHCHCESCRRATSAPFTTYLGVPLTAFEWIGEPPATYASSPGVERSFCATCGSPMAYSTQRLSHEIHLFAASLSNSDNFSPQFHVFCRDMVRWVTLSDGLPKHAQTIGQGED